MTLADSLAALLFVAVVVYAVLAGADFGAGFWDLLAGDPERGAAQRRLIARSIGPVWEANHVWLIFALVLLWTCFPSAFGSIASTLFVPLSLVGIGVILRGAAFAFRKEMTGLQLRRLFGATFAASSVITPFFLGAIVGAIASGRVPADGRGHWFTSWVNPTSVLGGVLAVLACAFLAATYLAADAARTGERALAEAFRSRALVMAALTGVVALVGIVVLRTDADTLAAELTRGADLVVLPGSALAGTATIGLLLRRSYARARIAAAVAVVAVLAGWGIAQYPEMLVDELTIEEAAGHRATLVAVWTAVGIGLSVLIPSLAYLFRFVERRDVAPEEVPARSAGPPTAPASTGGEPC